MERKGNHTVKDTESTEKVSASEINCLSRKFAKLPVKISRNHIKPKLSPHRNIAFVIFRHLLLSS